MSIMAPETSDPSDILRQILQLADAYRQAEQDDEDLLQVEKVTSLVQQLLAKQQSERDGLLQGKYTPSALRRIGG